MFEFPTRDRHPPYVVARIEFKEMTSNRKNDPDGIRTRVAALKGPCPRPLDDGACLRPSHRRITGGSRGRNNMRSFTAKASAVGLKATAASGRCFSMPRPKLKLTHLTDSGAARMV